jgi:hypothetical protein
MDGLADARACCLDAGQGDGFQEISPYLNEKSWKNAPNHQKPPAAFAGGGLCAALLLNPVRQASLPARRLGP